MTLLDHFALLMAVAASAAVLKPQPRRQKALIPAQAGHVTVIPGYLKSTPDTDHYARLEAQGVREIRVSKGGQTVERRTFPA